MTGIRAGRARTIAAVGVLALLAGCGGGGSKNVVSSGGADTTVSAPTTGADSNGAPKAAPRWETVTTLSGNAGTSTTAPFTILAGAIQWRARWSCDSGTLHVETDPAPRRPGALVDGACPTKGEGYSIVTGSVKLAVSATGPWQVTVDQQIDTPLEEPPLPAMAAAKVLSQGDFYNVEKNGKGSAKIYQLADGARALRLDSLEVNQNTDLFIWLDAAAAPKTSKDAVSAEYWVLGNLKSTIGSQNYEIPADIPVNRVRSIVIWCQPVAIAYAAAALS